MKTLHSQAYEIQERISEASTITELNELWQKYDKGLNLIDRCILDRWISKARRRLRAIQRMKKDQFINILN